VVAERRSQHDYDRVETIASFGEGICASAGKSSLREIVVRATEPGGCAVNLGDGLAALGAEVHAYATLGEPIHPVFAPIVNRFAHVESWGEHPGRTLAFEFGDGKLMFSSVRPLANFDPDLVGRKLVEGTFKQACGAAKVIGLTNWSLYPHMTEVWRLLRREVFVALDSPGFFVDLVDPASRSDADVSDMLGALAEIEGCGHLVLGLNGSEAERICQVAGLALSEDPGAWAQTAGELARRIGIHGVVIHTPRFAAGAMGSEQASLPTDYCDAPKKSTGAGDRFNAGFVFGLLSGAPIEVCLALGNAGSGFYIRHARSGTRTELASFCRNPSG
jgi:sugar/nucleoside kinase (ribokinase family)